MPLLKLQIFLCGWEKVYILLVQLISIYIPFMSLLSNSCHYLTKTFVFFPTNFQIVLLTHLLHSSQWRMTELGQHFHILNVDKPSRSVAILYADICLQFCLYSYDFYSCPLKYYYPEKQIHTRWVHTHTHTHMAIYVHKWDWFVDSHIIVRNLILSDFSLKKFNAECCTTASFIHIRRVYP